MDSKVLRELEQFDSCMIANAIEQTNVRLRNEGFMDGSVRCRTPDLPPIVGYAVTVRTRASAPPPDGHLYADRTDWWNYILSVPAPRVIVIEDADRYTGLGAFVGEVHAAIFQRLGCIGAITNGAVRDLPGVRKLGFRLFSGSLSVSHAYTHIVDFGRSVQVGGLQIRSGDILHGDLHGVVEIPPGIAAQIPALVERQRKHEREILELCRSQDFSIEQLRESVRHML